MIHSSAYILSACVFGFLMAWAVGANGLANIMSTTIGSKSVSVRTAMVVAIIFACLGAFFGGANVTHTIRNGIVNINLFTNSPELLIYGMIATLIASMIWTMLCSFVGLPVSITNAIIGSIMGFGAIVLGIHAVHWGRIFYICLSWIIAPVIAGVIAYFIFIFTRIIILAADDPSENARKLMPVYFFLVGIILAIMTVIKDLAHFGIKTTFWQRFDVVFLAAAIITLIGKLLCNKVVLEENPKRYQRFEYVEKLFAILMAFTACAMVFGLGSNDIAVTIGPVATILSIVKHHGTINSAGIIPIWAVVIASVGVIFGLLISGKKIIETVGGKITALTPTRAFAATFAAAGTVIVTTSLGIPVSATQILVGGVFGVGFARGIGALNVRIMRNIFLSWIITVPAAAIFGIIFFELIKFIFRW